MRPENVTTRQELASFLDELHERARERPDSIPNASLAEFLSGAAGWVDDMDGFFGNRGEATPSEPTWSLVAAIFEAATMYE